MDYYWNDVGLMVYLGAWALILGTCGIILAWIVVSGIAGWLRKIRYGKWRG
jgi:hypothetical protein